MATRLYLQNASAPYSPATLRGTWDYTTGYVDRALGTAKSGANTSIAIAEAVKATTYDVLLARFVSPALLGDKTFTASDTISWAMGIQESSALANDYTHIHVYVTAGDSDTVRGTLLADQLMATEWPTTAEGRSPSTTIYLAGTVNASAGDRIVVLIGYDGRSNSTTSYTGTLWYGGTGSTDLTNGSANVTTEPGWVEFSQDGLMDPSPRNVDLSGANGEASAVTEAVVASSPALDLAATDTQGTITDTASGEVTGGLADIDRSVSDAQAVSDSPAEYQETVWIQEATSASVYIPEAGALDVDDASEIQAISEAPLGQASLADIAVSDTQDIAEAITIPAISAPAASVQDAQALSEASGALLDELALGAAEGPSLTEAAGAEALLLQASAVVEAAWASDENGEVGAQVVEDIPSGPTLSVNWSPEDEGTWIRGVRIRG